MKQEQLFKSIDLIKEYNKDLSSKLKVVNKIIKGKSKTRKEVSIEQIQEILILISILLSGNIKVRYELDEWVKENKAFASLTQLKSISTNCKQDLDALKSLSFTMTEFLKSMKLKQEETTYKESVI